MTLLVLQQKYVFIKTCAFSCSIRIRNQNFRHSQGDCIINKNDNLKVTTKQSTLDCMLKLFSLLLGQHPFSNKWLCRQFSAVSIGIS